MPKVSISTIKRPERKTFVVELTDPPRGEEGKPGYYAGNPDLKVPLTLRKLGGAEWIAATADAAKAYTAKYVTGKGDPDKPGYEPPVPIPPVDGQTVYLSETTCQVLAAVEYAQTCPNEDRYTFEELAAFATLDAVLGQLMAAFDRISFDVEDDQEGSDADPLAAARTAA
jgi:hypothetical protein